MSRRKAFRALVELAGKYHLEFEGVTGKGHLRWRDPRTNRVVVTISDASSWRSLKNAERDFRSNEVFHGQYDHAH